MRDPRTEALRRSGWLTFISEYRQVETEKTYRVKISYSDDGLVKTNNYDLIKRPSGLMNTINMWVYERDRT